MQRVSVQLKHYGVPLVILVMGLVLLIRYEKPIEKLPYQGRVVLIGIDGLSWTPLLPLLKKGALPGLASVMKRGTYGDVQTVGLNLSPHVWANVATGVTADKHDISTRYRLDRGKQRITCSSDWQFQPVWSLLSAEGLNCAVLGWPASWPAQRVKGIMLSDLVYPAWGGFSQKELAQIEGKTYPAPLSEELPAFTPSNTSLDSSNRRETITQALERARSSDKGVLQSCIYYFRKYNPLLTMVYLGGYHRLIKVCAQPRQVKPSAKDAEPYSVYTIPEANRPLVEQYLVALDQQIQRLLEMLDEKDVVFILSGRGLIEGSIDNVVNDPDVSLPLGIVAAAGPAIKEYNRPVLAGSLEMAPTLLYLFDKPLPLKMDGGVMMLALKESLTFHRKVRFRP